MKKSHLLAVLFASAALVSISFISPSKNADARVAGIETVATTLSVNNANELASAALSAALYENLNLAGAGLSKKAVDYAVRGYSKLVNKGAAPKQQYLTIVDFSQSSRSKRFYLIDVENQKLVMNTFVAHGKKSGLDRAEKFSNAPRSNQSSLGFYVTKGTYTGKHGTSMRLGGMEEGFNSNAEARAIVVHGANYVSPGRVNSAYMGRSQGCPALSESDYAKAINYMKNGSVMFIYHPTASNYVNTSKLLNG